MRVWVGAAKEGRYFASTLATLATHMANTPATCCAHFADMSIVMITHGLTLRILLMKWFHWTVDEFLEVFNPANCEVGAHPHPTHVHARALHQIGIGIRVRVGMPLCHWRAVSRRVLAQS